MNYGLATPPTSPIRQKNVEKFWPETSKGNTITKSITQSGIVIKGEDPHDISLLTPPASPTKDITSPQEGRPKLYYQTIVPNSDDQSSGTDEDVRLLNQDHSIGQLDGTDVLSKQTSNSASSCLSDRDVLPTIGSKNLGESLRFPLDESIITQKEKDCFAQISSLKTQRSRPLTPFSLRRTPMLATPVQSRGCPASLQRSYTSPDRFIAQRSPPDDDIVTSFKVGKPTDKLSDAEKITRSQSTGPDPFSTHIPHIVPLSQSRVRAPISNLGHERLVSQNNIGMLGLHQLNDIPQRQVSGGTVWCVGGPGAVTDPRIGVSDGRGGLLRSGTNAPLYGNLFTSRADAASVLNAHERRVALAADLDQSRRTITVNKKWGDNAQPVTHNRLPIANKTTWRDNEWAVEGNIKLLDAPLLRDDFYCSLLAYSRSAECLAVGLGSQVYLWSEAKSVRSNDNINSQTSAYVASLSFSSLQGGRSILAIGRNDGHVTLWSPLELDFRFVVKQQNPISCVSFSSKVVKRPSYRDPAIVANVEELLVGDEAGFISIYTVEWPSENNKDLFGWPGVILLVTKFAVHSQQVCGLAWAPSGNFFATGGNDNSCCVFERNRIIRDHPNRRGETMIDVIQSSKLAENTSEGKSEQGSRPGQAQERHRWNVNAAVKAIAFCPWQDGLIAIGGGSNDRCIHFYHVQSGACLATIDCAAQVTSLIWSTTRREIVATFGFPQPEHPYRIAVFSWPNCAQIVAIPWADEDRALYAISYPGGPNNGRTNGEGGSWWPRTEEEGCIVIATSGASIKFHEVWSEGRKATSPRKGTLGGSDILEFLHGIEKDNASIIR